MRKKIRKYNKKKIDEVKIPAVVGEIMGLLEEKRVKCVSNIEKRFDEYYKSNRLLYHKYRKNLVKITYPTNPAVVYDFKSKEYMKLFFIYWLFTEYSNPSWEKDGINIINVLCNLESAYLYKNDWKSFHYWWQQKVMEQNLAYRLKSDHLYLQEIVQQSNTLFQILRGMNFNNYNSLIGKLNTVKNFWKSEAKSEEQLKIKALDLSMKPIPKPRKFEKYIEEWKGLRASSETVKEAYRELCRLHPDDKELRWKNPEYFNRYMNNYI